MDAYQLCLCRFMLGETALLHADKYRRDDGQQRQHYLCASFNQLFWLELRHLKHMKWHPHGKALMVPLDADGSLHEESGFRQEADILPDESSDSRDDARHWVREAIGALPPDSPAARISRAMLASYASGSLPVRLSFSQAGTQLGYTKRVIQRARFKLAEALLQHEQAAGMAGRLKKSGFRGSNRLLG